MIVDELHSKNSQIFEDFIVNNLGDDLYITDITYNHTRLGNNGDGYICYKLYAFTPHTVRRSPGEDPDEHDVYFYDDKVSIFGLSEYNKELSSKWLEEIMIPTFGKKAIDIYKESRAQQKKSMNIMFDLETDKALQKYKNILTNPESNK